MDNLYAAIVHDVKNQLAELALRLGERTDAQSEMAIAINAANRLSEMLLLQRHADHPLPINPVAVNAADFLSMLAVEYRELFPNIIIWIDSDRAPAFSFFDVNLVRMALANALHNACRSARQTVTLLADTQDGMLMLGVADDGTGYPEIILQHGGREPAAVSGRGTGLGLFLARQIAELHQLNGQHGRISLSNQPGAVFKMYLP